MRVKFLLVAGALCAAAAVGAVGARAADISGVELRPGVPGLQYTAGPGETNDLRVSGVNPRVIDVRDDGAVLTTAGTWPCRLLSAHKARCKSPVSSWARLTVYLKDGADRVRMRPSLSVADAEIYSDDGGDRYLLRGSNTWLESAYTGDRVRFLPPGGGGVVVYGSPRLWLVDGATEYVDCRIAGTPRIFSDPLDQISPFC